MSYSYLSATRVSCLFLCFAWSSLPGSFAAQFDQQPWRPTFAQDPTRRREIAVHGQISTGSSPVGNWTIELCSLSSGELLKTYAGWNGAFELRRLTPGEHKLRVVDANGRVLHDEIVSLQRDDETVSILLQVENMGNRGQGQTVSVQQLQHKVPRKAIKEIEKGRADLDKRQFSRAMVHLKAAVAADPAFADAYNDLGVAHYELEEYKESLEQFRKAVEIAPGHELANNNVCLVLLKTGRYAEAGQAAHSVLKRGSGSAMAHYAAAAAMLFEGGSLNEALRHLVHAQRDMPRAHLFAARALAGAGRPGDAARELEAYLRTSEPDAKRRPDLEAWLSQLKQK
jgi:tetratricopeptide (TPR) repeat protein